MFAGVISFNGALNTHDRLIELSQLPNGLANIPYDDSSVWQDNALNSRVTLVQQRRWNTAESRSVSGMVEHIPSRTRIIAWARIDNRPELLGKLSKDMHGLCASDEGLVLASYLQWGKRVCEHLIGDFSFAIYDGRDGSLFCGRDHTGVKPFYYYWDENLFAFASSQAVLNKLPGINLEISEEWSARYLLGVSQDWTLTSYQKIKKLAPAFALSLVDKKVKLERYFDFSDQSDLILGSDEEYVEAYREVLHQAVACRVQSGYPIGSESSGGLDSSTVTALASRYMSRPGRDLHAFGYDESELTPECIISVSQTNPLAMTHFASRTRAHSPNLEERFYQCYGAPVEQANGISHHMFYEIAQNLQIRTLLSGFGGDEFVTSAAPVALVEFWQNKQLGLFYSRQRGQFLKPFHMVRWLYQYYRHSNRSVTSRSLYEAMEKKWTANLLKGDVAKRFALKEKMLRRDIYDGGKQTQNEFALNDRWSPAMTARYENCTLMAASYGIDYRWPLMDIRLLRLFLSIPASQKLGPGLMGRYLHRRAVADILPEFITWKSKDMEPFKFWQRLKLWGERTALVKRLKQIARPSPLARQVPHSLSVSDNQIPSNKRLLSFDLHPTVDDLICRDKLDKTVRLIDHPSLKQHEKRLLFRQIGQLRQLNDFFNYSK